MISEPTPMRVVFVGWGAIATTASRLLADAPVDIVAVAVRDGSKARSGLPPGTRLLTRPQELGDIGAELVIEAAGRESVVPWGSAALELGCDLIVSSVSALADPDVLDTLQAVARRTNAKIHIPPGALGGIDALAAAEVMGIDDVEHRIVKPPRAWLGTPAETMCDLSALLGPVEFFRGTATEAASRFPKNANVAMTTALAGRGPADTQIALVADPDAAVNRHEVRARGAFGELTTIVHNKPLPENPRTSALTALSLVRAIRNRIGPLVI